MPTPHLSGSESARSNERLTITENDAATTSTPERPSAPFYTIRVGDKYLSRDLGSTLVDTINEAIVYEVSDEGMAYVTNIFSEQFYPREWPEPARFEEVPPAETVCAAVDQAPTADTETKADEQDDDADDPGWFHDLGTTRVLPQCLEVGMGNSLLRSIILAFCSFEEKSFEQSSDVYPMPHQSGRAGAKLLFRVGTDELTAETASEWRFRKGDWIGVHPDCKLDYDNGDLVVAVVDASLTILELRSSFRGLHPYELRKGKILDIDSVFVIGRVREFRRSYWGPSTPEDRAIDAALKAEIARANSVKGGSTPKPSGFDAAYSKALAAEQVAETAAAPQVPSPHEPGPLNTTAELVDLLRLLRNVKLEGTKTVATRVFWTKEQIAQANAILATEVAAAERGSR